MSVMNIKWHEGCIENMKATIDREMIRVQEAEIALRRSRGQYSFYKEQIETAKQLGKGGFDRERFLVKKGTRTHD